MAVHLIFCRIIAEVVRPLPPSVRRHPPRHRSLATPVILLFVLPPPPRCPAPVAVGRVDERGRALCLTFCKNCPPLPRTPPPLPPPSPLRPPHPLSPPLPPPSPPHAPSTLSSSFSPTPPLFNSSLSRLSYGVLLYTLGCAARRYIVLSRRRISNMMDARAGTQSLSIFSFSFSSFSSFPFRTRRTRRCAIANSERKGAARRPQLVA